jgi:hypothetical protein
MTSAEVKSLIEDTLAALPGRLSGNEAYSLLAERLRPLVGTNRKSVVEALKSYLRFRVAAEQRRPEDAVPEARIWMALSLSEQLSLIELKQEIRSLVNDIRDSKIFLPVHEASVAKYLQRLSVSSK